MYTNSEIVVQMLEDLEISYFSKYNDKRKDHRRLKFVITSPTELKVKLRLFRNLLKRHLEDQFISAETRTTFTDGGHYESLIVRVKF